MLKAIRIYAEFYDGELNSAWILCTAKLSPSSSVVPFQPSPCQKGGWKGTILQHAESMQNSIHHHKILHIF